MCVCVSKQKHPCLWRDPTPGPPWYEPLVHRANTEYYGWFKIFNKIKGRNCDFDFDFHRSSNSIYCLTPSLSHKIVESAEANDSERIDLLIRKRSYWYHSRTTRWNSYVGIFFHLMKPFPVCWNYYVLFLCFRSSYRPWVRSHWPTWNTCEFRNCCLGQGLRGHEQEGGKKRLWPELIPACINLNTLALSQVSFVVAFRKGVYSTGVTHIDESWQHPRGLLCSRSARFEDGGVMKRYPKNSGLHCPCIPSAASTILVRFTGLNDCFSYSEKLKNVNYILKIKYVRDN